MQLANRTVTASCLPPTMGSCTATCNSRTHALLVVEHTAVRMGGRMLKFLWFRKILRGGPRSSSPPLSTTLLRPIAESADPCQNDAQASAMGMHSQQSRDILGPLTQVLDELGDTLYLYHFARIYYGPTRLAHASSQDNLSANLHAHYTIHARGMQLHAGLHAGLHATVHAVVDEPCLLLHLLLHAGG